jgi:hypothetical protein
MGFGKTAVLDVPPIYAGDRTSGGFAVDTFYIRNEDESGRNNTVAQTLSGEAAYKFKPCDAVVLSIAAIGEMNSTDGHGASSHAATRTYAAGARLMLDAWDCLRFEACGKQPFGDGFGSRDANGRRYKPTVNLAIQFSKPF